MLPRLETSNDHDLIAKTRHDYDALPILFLSRDLHGLVNSDQIKPPSAFLLSPFNPSELLAAVETLLSDPSSLTRNRVSSSNRNTEDRPTGTPTDDRYAMETAHSWEDEERPGSLNDQLTNRNDASQASPLNFEATSGRRRR